MEPVIEVLDFWPLKQTKRIQVSSLVTADSIGVDQLKDPNLFLFGTGDGGGSTPVGRVAALILGDVAELFSYVSVGNVGAMVTWNTGKLIKIPPPFLRYAIGIVR